MTLWVSLRHGLQIVYQTVNWTSLATVCIEGIEIIYLKARGGGGLALYIKDNLVSSRYDLLPNKECEGVWARIFLGKKLSSACRSASIE